MNCWKGEKPWRAVAVFDGKGESASVALYWENEDTGCIKEIPWPESFPQWVTSTFLVSQGFECIVA